MADYEYRPERNVHEQWSFTITDPHKNYEDSWNLDSLYEVEVWIKEHVEDHIEESGAVVALVEGAHGWRKFTFEDGDVIKFEWEQWLLDLRCEVCRGDADTYMVHNELWDASGLDGMVCFRCLEKTIGRVLTPGDFIKNMPVNTNLFPHCDELKERIGPV